MTSITEIVFQASSIDDLRQRKRFIASRLDLTKEQKKEIQELAVSLKKLDLAKTEENPDVLERCACLSDREIQASSHRMLLELGAEASSQPMFEVLKRLGTRIHSLYQFQFGDFVVLDEIGRGGMATTYRAFQTSLKREVAIKVLHMDSNQELVWKFKQEGELCGRVNHENLLEYYSTDSTAIDHITVGSRKMNVHWIAMELFPFPGIVSFCSNLKRLDSRGIHSPIDLIRQACDGVQHLHEKGIIHGDISPANILVSSDETKPKVKVIDFGLGRYSHTKSLESLTKGSSFAGAGTQNFMSPEVENGSLPDVKSDIFSLGKLLDELVSSETTVSAYELQSVRLKACSKDLTARYQTVKELATDLECLSTKRPLVYADSSRPLKMRAFISDHKWLVGSLVSSFALAILLFTQYSAVKHKLENAAAEQAQTYNENNQHKEEKFLLSSELETEQLKLSTSKRLQDNHAKLIDRVIEHLSPKSGTREHFCLHELFEQQPSILDGLYLSHPREKSKIQFQIGKAYFDRGRVDLASELFRRASELNACATEVSSFESVRCLFYSAMANLVLDPLDKDALRQFHHNMNALEQFDAGSNDVYSCYCEAASILTFPIGDVAKADQIYEQLLTKHPDIDPTLRARVMSHRAMLWMIAGSFNFPKVTEDDIRELVEKAKDIQAVRCLQFSSDRLLTELQMHCLKLRNDYNPENVDALTQFYERLTQSLGQHHICVLFAKGVLSDAYMRADPYNHPFDYCVNAILLRESPSIGMLYGESVQFGGLQIEFATMDLMLGNLYYSLGLNHYAQDRLGNAISFLGVDERNRQAVLQAKLVFANCCVSLGEFDRANKKLDGLAQLVQAKDIHWTVAEYLQTVRARIKWKIHDLDGALELIDSRLEVIKELPYNQHSLFTYYSLRGLCLMENGDFADGQLAFKKAGEVMSQLSPESWYLSRCNHLQQALGVLQSGAYEPDLSDTFSKLLTTSRKLPPHVRLDLLEESIDLQKRACQKSNFDFSKFQPLIESALSTIKQDRFEVEQRLSAVNSPANFQ